MPKPFYVSYLSKLPNSFNIQREILMKEEKINKFIKSYMGNLSYLDF